METNPMHDGRGGGEGGATGAGLQQQQQQAHQVQIQRAGEQEAGPEIVGGLPVGHITKRFFATIFLVCLSSFLYGYSISALNTVIKSGDSGDPKDCYKSDDDDDDCPDGSMLNDIELDTQLAEVATGMTIFGAWLGVLAAPKPSEQLGRRSTLLYNNIFFLIGGIFCAVPTNSSVAMLFIGRFLLGLGIGVESMVVPVLLSEYCTKESRGKVTSYHQLLLTIGILVSAIIGFFCVTYLDQGWRVVQIFLVVPAITQILGGGLIPESPRWLAKKGRMEEARKVLELIRPREHARLIEQEMADIAADASSNDESEHVSWQEVFMYKGGVVIGITMMAMQALTGINSVIFYSTTVFGFAGVKEDILGTLSVGVINVVMTVVSGLLVDRWGRKTLLLNGTLFMTVCLVVLGCVLLSLNSESTAQGAIAVLAVLGYVVGFAVGMGAVIWVVISEIMPDRIRAKAFSLFVSINWFCNLIIALFTLTSINGLGGVSNVDDDDKLEDGQKRGVAILYLLFAGLSLGTAAFIFLKIPETKGLTVSQAVHLASPSVRHRKSSTISAKLTGDVSERLIGPRSGEDDVEDDRDSL